ncbi:MAG: Crp/Fnr family transcriptional regulator [Flavobacteriaceae bacterium]
MIDAITLTSYGAITIPVKKGEVVFMEHDKARYYFQSATGKIKMYNTSQDGKEFVQGIFGDGHSFGEPPLLGDFSYPSTAVVVDDGELYRLPLEQFRLLLTENPELHLEFTAHMCKRLGYKAMMGRELSIHPPEHRILTLLGHLKLVNDASNTLYQVPLTRKQIGEMTGLRVETVIRTIKKLEQDEKLMLKNHKIFL